MTYVRRALQRFVLVTAVLWAALPVWSQTRAPQRAAVVPIQALSESFEKLAQATAPAVVQISISRYTLAPDSGQNAVAALSRERGVGSGVVLSADGYIVTNAHVVRDAQRVTVTVHDSGDAPDLEETGTELPAQVVGADSETDLAVIKVERTGMAFLKLGDSGQVRQGQLVLAFGSPLGLSNSMTMGVISAAARQLREEDFMQYIQTDTPINPGNSGGPLVDAAGNVIGINTMILTQSGGSEGVGLAIPSNLVRSVFEQLKAHGHVHRGLIGANAQTLSPALVEGLGLSTQTGAVISDVLPGGPADVGGLQTGDVVVKMNQVPLRTAHQLENAVFRATNGQKLQFTLQRGTEQQDIEVTVVERPHATDRLAASVNPKNNLIPQLGILALTIDKDAADMLPSLRLASGVAVAALTHDPAAWTAQLEPGDVIHQVNTTPVVSIGFLREKLESIAAGAAVVLQIERGETLRFISFRAE